MAAAVAASSLYTVLVVAMTLATYRLYHCCQAGRPDRPSTPDSLPAPPVEQNEYLEASGSGGAILPPFQVRTIKIFFFLILLTPPFLTSNFFKKLKLAHC